MKVQAVKCEKCGDIVFSRAVNDLRGCTCGSVLVSGGLHNRGKPVIAPGTKYRRLTLVVEATVRQLYDDWTSWTDKFGRIKDKKIQ